MPIIKNEEWWTRVWAQVRALARRVFPTTKD